MQQEMREPIIRYIRKYIKLIESGAMTLGGLHKLMVQDGIKCSRNYVYHLYNQINAGKKSKKKPAHPSKGKAGGGGKNL